ncbi:dihydropteroate synthase [Flavobacteriaceae bacterium]|nr:dihydropteroate synthase [Flavobacteriaceae bacterium]
MRNSINCRGKLLDLSEPKVMGILNLTPDSFYDGGQNTELKQIQKKVSQMLADGMDILDVGAVSSKPGAEHVSLEEETQRLIPVVQHLHRNFPDLILSIDTFRAKIAEKAIASGASMINDISAGNLDDEMIDCVTQLQVPYIAMHMQGTPQSMQDNPNYENLIIELIKYFSELQNRCYKKGLNDLIIDPGFGFGKTLNHNYELLKNLNLFHSLELPMLVGISRKSMLYKPLNTSAEQALNATSVAHTLALANGANILRVHDVKQAKETIEIYSLYEKA